MEEDLSRVVSRSIEVVFLARDHTRVTNGVEVNAKLFVIVCPDVLIEDLGDTIYGIGLKDDINWGVDLGEIISTEDCNS
jgi:hypothetical protein